MRGHVWLYKDNQYKRVSPDAIDPYLKDGWIKQAPKQNRSKESAEKYRQASLDRIHIHKNTTNKNIKPELLQEFLNDGWELGYFYKKRKFND